LANFYLRALPYKAGCINFSLAYTRSNVSDTQLFTAPALPTAGDTGDSPNPSALPPISSSLRAVAGASHRHNQCGSPGWRQRAFPSPSGAASRRSWLPGHDVELRASAFMVMGCDGGRWVPVPALFGEGGGRLLGVSHGVGTSPPPWVSQCWMNLAHPLSVGCYAACGSAAILVEREGLPFSAVAPSVGEAAHRGLVRLSIMGRRALLEK
jgi:hypothetical protein